MIETKFPRCCKNRRRCLELQLLSDATTVRRGCNGPGKKKQIQVGYTQLLVNLQFAFESNQSGNYSHQLVITSYQFAFECNQPVIDSHQLVFNSYQFPFESNQSVINRHYLVITSHQQVIKIYQFAFDGHQLVITRY